MEEVKIKDHGKAECPICGETGEYEEDGQTCSESEWVWEDGKLIAVPSRDDDECGL